MFNIRRRVYLSYINYVYVAKIILEAVEVSKLFMVSEIKIKTERSTYYSTSSAKGTSSHEEWFQGSTEKEGKVSMSCCMTVIDFVLFEVFSVFYMFKRQCKMLHPSCRK